MRGIRIFMEGGGDRTATRNELRREMNWFLREVWGPARARLLEWKIVCCGSRSEAYLNFKNAVMNSGASGDVNILLVDAEAPVDELPRAHLKAMDRWDLGFASESAVHLMVQVMETWIVADPEGLSRYYGQGFNKTKLPQRPDLEREPKNQVARALRQATKRTRKGPYHKMKHARVLRHVDPAQVRERCPHCKRLFAELDRVIANLSGSAV